ncbi:MAG: DUF3606 domain-containing protein [Variovorax sp.]|nr:MAG: DUF3606 domain-containing protein [Variovorax sp.]
MSDELSHRGAQDRSRIDINEAHEVDYWVERFGVNETELRLAVAEVGVATDAVSQHLGKA